MTAGRVAVVTGTAGEIADAVADLASDTASYLHGTVLMADGGVTA